MSKLITKSLKLILPVIFALLMYIISGSWDLDSQQRVVLSIIIVAGYLWLTELVPLYVTSFIIAFLLIFFGDFQSREVFSHFFDNIIVLFLGGFTLAAAFSKYSIDKLFAEKVIGFLGNDYRKILIGLMFLTAFLSFWMSNTATAALMIPIGISILKNSGISTKDSIYKLYPLALAYSSTIGGLGTIIGSPPNALAVRFLSDSGNDISFLGWMRYMVPFVFIFLIFVALLMILIYKTSEGKLKFEHSHDSNKLKIKGKVVVIIAILSIILWIFGSTISLPSYLVALIPVIIFFGFNILNREDLNKLNWDTLLLFGGGIAMGEAVKSSGLDLFIAENIEIVLSGLSIIVLYYLVVLIALAFTIVASNTGAAVLMMPIIITIATQLGLDPVPLIMITTLGVSLDFVLPIGTPPTAIAYSTGFMKTKEIVRIGLILTFVMSLFAVIFGYFIW